MNFRRFLTGVTFKNKNMQRSEAIDDLKNRNLLKYRVVVEYEAQTEKNKPVLARHLNLDRTQIKRILDKWENLGS